MPSPSTTVFLIILKPLITSVTLEVYLQASPSGLFLALNTTLESKFWVFNRNLLALNQRPVQDLPVSFLFFHLKYQVLQ